MTNTPAHTRATLQALLAAMPELDRGMATVSGRREMIFLDIDFNDWLVVRMPHGNRKNRLPGVFYPPASKRGPELAEKIWAVWPTICPATVAA